VLRVAACGICGTDLHVHQAGFLPTGAIMGHEFCGEVVEAAGDLRVGERVCALPVLSCGRCRRCRSGLGAYCSEQRALGLGQAAGAFAEYVTVAPHEVVRLPDGGDDTLGALVEPVAVGLHAVGAPGLIQQCIERVRFRGRIVVAGVCMTPDTFHPGPAVLKEASLQFVLAYEKDDFQHTVDLLEQGRIRPEAMITERIDLAGVPAAFDALAQPSDQCKLLVLPWS